jgi:glycosyltransferase involved in cell wall biosynthesis
MIVTIVTPTLNAIEYLGECIESTRRNQTSSIQVEHVIVDGGSTDGTVELARSYGLPVMVGKDKGIFDAINKGSFNSSGELIGFLGADDMLLDGVLDPVVDVYRRSQRRWVVGGIRWIDEKGSSLGELSAPPRWMTLKMYPCMGWNPLMQMAIFFSRPFFVELDGYNSNYKDSGDFEMFARAIAKAPYARMNRPLACFRRTGMNNSAVHHERTARENQTVLDAFGPSSRAERMFWRYAMKSWFNLTNPEWLIRKTHNAACVRLGLQRKAYF